MAVRGFTDGDALVLDVGDNNITGAQPYTIAFLIKRGVTDAWNPIIAGHEADGDQSWAMYFQGLSGGTGINRLTMINTAAGGTSNSTFVVDQTSEYVLIAFTCPGSFNDLGRWHILTEAGVWTHQAGTEPGTPLRGLTDIAGGHLRIGESDGTPDLTAHVAFVEIWHANLTDAQVEAAAANLEVDDSLRHEIMPASFWLLTQASTATAVTDLVGSSDQTSLDGTAVITDDNPPGWNLTASPLPLEVDVRLSGGATNTDPAASLGGAESSEEAGADLFDDVSFARTVAGQVDYRIVYLHDLDSVRGGPAVARVSTQLGAGCELAIGAATEDAGDDVGAIPDDLTAPPGVVFSAVADVDLGDLDPGLEKGLWIRRTVDAGTAPGDSNPWQIEVEISEDPTPPTFIRFSGDFEMLDLEPTILVWTGTEWFGSPQRVWTGTEWFPPVTA